MVATDRAYKNARSLRRTLSPPEVLLWARLRRSEVRIRRQHPIGPYVLDFYCPAAKIGFEVDGMIHDVGDRPQRDAIRARWLAEQGVELLRLRASEVMANPDEVAQAVLFLCSDDPNPSTTSLRAAVPLPMAAPQGGA